MKKHNLFVIGVIFVSLAASVVAATWDDAKPIHRGTTPGVAKLTIGSTTATALWPGGYSQMDCSCRNNSADTVWIGTVSYTQASGLHPNIANGMPLLSSETFKLDGMFTGLFYGTCDTGKTCDVRCMYGTVSR